MRDSLLRPRPVPFGIGRRGSDSAARDDNRLSRIYEEHVVEVIGVSTADSHWAADQPETFHRTLEPDSRYAVFGKVARSTVVDDSQVGALDQAIRRFSVDGSRR